MPTPEPPQTRLARSSLKAFVLGLAGAVAGFIAVFILAIFVHQLPLHADSLWLLMILPLGFFAAGVASLIVSLVWGLRVVKSRRYVLWWVIPAGLAMAFLAGLLLFAAVLNFVYEPSYSYWGGNYVVFYVALIAAGIMTIAALRREATLDQRRLNDSGMTKDDAGDEPAPANKFGGGALVFAVVGIVAAGIGFLLISSLSIRLDTTNKALDKALGELEGTVTPLANALLDDYKSNRHQSFDLTNYEGLEQQIRPRSRDSAELRDERIRLAGMNSVVKEGSAAIEAQIRRIGDLEKGQQRPR